MTGAAVVPARPCPSVAEIVPARSLTLAALFTALPQHAAGDEVGREFEGIFFDHRRLGLEFGDQGCGDLAEGAAVGELPDAGADFVEHAHALGIGAPRSRPGRRWSARLHPRRGEFSRRA